MINRVISLFIFYGTYIQSSSIEKNIPHVTIKIVKLTDENIKKVVS